jgi:alpha-1,2-glucosyltransferase
VRQAQVYCSGDFGTWDPKITTPPGLYVGSQAAETGLMESHSYLLSYAVLQVTGSCDIKSLRLLNATCLGLVGLVSFSCLQVLWQVYHPRPDSVNAKRHNAVEPSDEWYLTHSAINICLFPPLFFFSGLYYTDIASTLIVLLSLRTQLASQEFNWPLAVLQLLFACSSLFFRQTNIFWVGVFPIGITLLNKCLPVVKDWWSLDDAKGGLEGM